MQKIVKVNLSTGEIEVEEKPLTVQQKKEGREESLREQRRAAQKEARTRALRPLPQNAGESLIRERFEELLEILRNEGVST